MTSRSKLYFAALLSSQELQTRGCSRVLACMPHNYYKCLLQKDTSSLAQLFAIEDIDLRGYSDVAFKLFLQGRPLMDVLGAVAIEDAEDEGMAEVDDLGEDFVRPPPIALPAPPGGDAEVIGPALAGRDAAIEFAPVQVRDLLVYFSYDIGMIRSDRAYVNCPNHEHGRCVKERSFTLSPTRAGIYAYLMVWARQCYMCSREEHISREYSVDMVAVAALTAELEADGFQATRQMI